MSTFVNSVSYNAYADNAMGNDSKLMKGEQRVMTAAMTIMADYVSHYDGGCATLQSIITSGE